MNRVLITGNTYPVKESLKLLGGRWNPSKKGWEIPEDNADKARHLVRKYKNRPIEPEVKLILFPADSFDSEWKMASWSNDHYESIPFVCEPGLSDSELANAVYRGISKRFPPSHFGGCGYSCTPVKVVREEPTVGYVKVSHYHGIGD